MELALRLAQRGLGRVWPNPAVGCVLIDDAGHVVGSGWTQDGGRPHAETQAIAQAGEAARGATAYVSLEPCAHHGITGPCVDALIRAGVSRVVSAVEDPDQRVSGKGHAKLSAAGIEVRTKVLEAQARELNAGFFSRVQRNRAFVTLKLATTLDGKIALPSGESRWITGQEARTHVHLMRAQNDAVMVGIGSALADDPELTCRLRGVHHSRLVRVVVDSHARLPAKSKLAISAAKQPVWLLTGRSSGIETLAALNVKTIVVPHGQSGVDLGLGLSALAELGLTRIFVEGGARLASSLLKSGFVDQLLWYRAPTVMGEGLSAVAAMGAIDLMGLPRFILKETIRLGEDVLETYRRST